MFGLTIFPLRQKVLLGLTIAVGLFLIISSQFDLLQYNTLNQLILFYGIGIPLFLLMFDTVIDLNHKTIFIVWFTIAIITFVISLTTYGSDEFIIQRSSKFNPTSGLNRFMGKYSTSSLKALLIFLVVYWPLNKLLNKNGLFLINTFRQRKWHHDLAEREINALDVVLNLILYATILMAGLFGR